ncbi:MAG: serine/threonine protein kinase [Candidatus Obscuribacterales bacterium]|nr:serine/threonine protein kinase [Candidatus Obscuribacterales bacterium]
MESLIGSTIDDKYHVLSLLGSGGLGTVYKAEQKELSRNVALKVLHGSALSSEELQARFEQEARILAGLEHRNIVKVYSVGVIDSICPYMAMEFLDGRSLDQIIKEQHSLPWQRAVKIAIQVAEAADYAHEHGIIHRDLKAQNIMLLHKPEPDFVKVLDFGLSRVFNEMGDSVQKLTQTGTLIGSVHYMSPELCLGQKADRRSDIYSLGCMLYEMLSSLPPLDSENPISIINMQINDLPRSLRSRDFPMSAEISPELELLVFKSMQKDPAQRFQSMAEFAQALGLLLEGRGAELKLGEVRIGNQKARKAGAGKKIWLCLGVLLLLSIAFILPLCLQKNRTEKIVAGARSRQLNKSRQILAEAEKLFKRGKKHQAASLAKKIVNGLGKRQQANLNTKDSAFSDLEILSRTLPLLKDSGEVASVEDSRALEGIYFNDSPYINKTDHELEFDTVMAQFAALYCETPLSLEYLLRAARILAEEHKPELLLALMKELNSIYRRQGIVEGSPRAILIDASMMLAEARVFQAKGDSSGSVNQFNLIEEKLKLIDLEDKRILPLWLELSAQQFEMGQYARSEESGLKAINIAKRNDLEYVGSYFGTTQMECKRLIKIGAYDKAIDLMKQVERFEESKNPSIAMLDAARSEIARYTNEKTQAEKK